MPKPDDEVRRTLDALSAAFLTARLPAKEARASFPAGPSSLALVNHALERALPGRGHGKRAAAFWERAIAALADAPAMPWLYGGFTGVGWVAGQLAGPDAPEEDGNTAIDEALETLLRRRRWTESYDLITGLVGFGLYALERVPRPASVALLERIVEHLAASVEKQSVGLSWRSRPAWVPREMRTRFDRGFNVGLAHGVPGIIGLLGRIWRAGIAKKEAARLLDGAVAWLLAMELPKKSVSAFPMFSLEGEVPAVSRAAWCYGDPGIAAALLVAARATGETSWRRAAVRIGARVAARDLDTTGVRDAGICHGASGLAQIFRRLYAETEDARFDAAGRQWLGHAMAMRKEGQGLGGYLMDGDKGGKLARVRDAGFLTGTAGVAMTLTSFLVEPGHDDWCGWDRVLLLSDRPAPAPARALPTDKRGEVRPKAGRARAATGDFG
jgi:lantibiotic biosynthesis protein